MVERHCEKHNEVERNTTRLESFKDELKELKDTNILQWANIGTRIKTKTLYWLLGILIILFSSAIGGNYAISSDKTKDLKVAQSFYQKKQEEQYKTLVKKTDTIQEAIHQINMNVQAIQIMMEKKND